MDSSNNQWREQSEKRKSQKKQDQGARKGREVAKRRGEVSSAKCARGCGAKHMSK